jgi:hypothetical protein
MLQYAGSPMHVLAGANGDGPYSLLAAGAPNPELMGRLDDEHGNRLLP